MYTADSIMQVQRGKIIGAGPSYLQEETDHAVFPKAYCLQSTTTTTKIN